LQEPQATAEKHIIPVQAQGLKMISMGLLNPGRQAHDLARPMLHSVIRNSAQRGMGELELPDHQSPAGHR